MVGLREFQAHCQGIFKVPQVNHLEKHWAEMGGLVTTTEEAKPHPCCRQTGVQSSRRVSRCTTNIISSGLLRRFWLSPSLLSSSAYASQFTRSPHLLCHLWPLSSETKTDSSNFPCTEENWLDPLPCASSPPPVCGIPSNLSFLYSLNTPRPGLSGCCLWHTRVLHFSFWLCFFLLPLLQDFPLSLATWTNACHTRSPLLSMASYFRQKMLSFSLTLGLLKATPSISTAGGGEQNLYLNY